MASTVDLREVANDGIAARTDAIPAHVTGHVLKGTSVLGVSVALERATAFLANILSARLAGASAFGAYSVGISTANNISVYAAGGIGATATRFSGKYPYESVNYGTFARVLATVSLASAAIAALMLFAGAPWIASLLHRPDLTILLHWAAISAAGMIVLECARGFFVGQRRLAALVLLSLVVGMGMLALLPLMSRSGHPERMVASQGMIVLAAVLVCVLFAGPLKLLPYKHEVSSIPFARMLREIWGYGMVQLVGLLSANLAGWWVTVLVARGDATLVQMGFFAVASQLRNLVGLVPSLLTEGSFAAMAVPPEDAQTHFQHRVMSICTYVSTFVAFSFASLAIIVEPWALRLMYGSGYGAASLAVAVGMSVAVLQMGNSPTSARLSIVSIRYTAVVNTVWAIFTALIGTMWMLQGGSAWKAMAIFLAAHIVMAVLVLLGLKMHDHVPSGMVHLLAVSTAAVLVLCVLSSLRETRSGQTLLWTTIMMVSSAITLAIFYRIGKRHGLLPPVEVSIWPPRRGLFARQTGT
jgi:O-antigen/teichoic acid export membrane protein